MILTDVHTHTKFSADGIDEIEDIIRSAIQKGVSVYGISEHLDYDYAVNHILVHGKELPMLKVHDYFACARALQQKYASQIRLLVGIEVGFARNEKLYDMVNLMIARFRPDFIVNSVHTIDEFDIWFPEFYATRTKQETYTMYLKKVKESLSAGYPYDIISHLGYPSRKAPYRDNALRYSDFSKEIDDILTEIIARGKILEVNSSTRGAKGPCVPEDSILKRYYELGGRKISFSSDAHDCARICDKRDEVCALLRSIGFTYITLPDEEETKVSILNS